LIVCSNFKDVRMTSKSEMVFEVELESGEKIKATADHLFYTCEGWKRLKDLQEGELLPTLDFMLSSYQIKSIKYVGDEPVYNMEVEKYHNFIANYNFIVHNCIDSLRYALADLIVKRNTTMADIANYLIAKR
jgi:intein/homing endonuclease